MRDKQRLYLMENGHTLNKIGIAINPEKRRRQIELASGLDVSIVKCWQTLDANALEVEQYLHRHFARRRQHGEWFTKISPREVELAGYDLLECNNDGSIKRRI